MGHGVFCSIASSLPAFLSPYSLGLSIPWSLFFPPSGSLVPLIARSLSLTPNRLHISYRSRLTFWQPGRDQPGGSRFLLAPVLKREAVSNRKQAVVGLRGACRHEHQVLQVAAKPVDPEPGPELGPLRD